MLFTGKRRKRKTPLADLFLEALTSLLFWFNLLPTVYLWIVADDLYPNDIKTILTTSPWPSKGEMNGAPVKPWSAEILL